MGHSNSIADRRQTEPVEIETHLVPVDDIRPNDYNPNRMADAEFSEFVAEVKHLGRLPKPVVIRPKVGFSSAAFCIVDGEHGWRAAKEVGFEKIPCEIIHADDFEAMRQTYKRNQHGNHNAVLQGRMFRAMKAARRLSNRDLGKEISVSEGTIRNSLLWADAADLRNSYAPGGDPKFERMGIRQLRMYVRMPPIIGNYWVDAGAKTEELEAIDSEYEPDYLGERLERYVEAGLAPLFATGGFRDRIKQAEEYLDFQENVESALPNISEYLQPLVRLGLPLSVLDQVGFQQRDDQDPPLSIPLPPEDWQRIVNDIAPKADDAKTRDSMIGAAVRTELRRLGVDPFLAHVTVHTVEAMEAIKTAPDFIKNAKWMSYGSRWWLAENRVDGLPDDLLDSIKREVVQVAKVREEALATGQMAEKIRSLYGDKYTDVKAIFDAIFVQRMGEENRKLREEQFRDRAQMTAAIRGWAEKLHDIRTGQIGGKAASEVLVERLGRLETPEFHLITSLLLGEESTCFQRWLNAMNAADQESAP